MMKLAEFAWPALGSFFDLPQQPKSKKQCLAIGAASLPVTAQLRHRGLWKGNEVAGGMPAGRGHLFGSIGCPADLAI